MSPLLRFLEPALPPLEQVLALYGPAYGQGMLTNAGLVARFEAAAAERLGVRHAVAVSSCTSGLMLVLKAFGATGEVVVPSFTFFATAHSALWNGLRPVFADCDPETWTISPAAVERSITPRTGAILAVHLYGNPCDVDELSRIAARRRVKLVFDAAHAFGSRYKGLPVGQFGDAEVFSLSPTKLLVAGEGGLVATNDATLARRIRAARNYGDTGAYDPELLGLNARMTEFNAALALAGLGMVEDKVARHNQIAAEYTRRLASTPGLRFQAVRTGNLSAYKDFSILVGSGAGLSRNRLRAALLERNIETKAYFSPAVHQQRLYRGFAKAGLENTEALAAGILSLPIYHRLPLPVVAEVAGTVKEILAGSRSIRLEEPAGYAPAAQ